MRRSNRRMDSSSREIPTKDRPMPLETTEGYPRAVDVDRRLADAIERLGQGVRALAQRTAREFKLSPLQQSVVLALARLPSSLHEVGALAAEFDVTSPTMSDAVAALERKGLVARTQGEDGRRKLLTLTPEGGKVSDALRSWDGPLLAALGSITDADRATTLESLLCVIADLQQAGVISIARMCTTCRFFERHAHDDLTAPHHCHLLEMPLQSAQLQTDCPDHDPVGRLAG